MDTNSNNNTAAAAAAGNNCRKYKRASNSNPKSKKQLENELNRQRSFFVAEPQNHSATNMLHHNKNTQVYNNDTIVYLQNGKTRISKKISKEFALTVN